MSDREEASSEGESVPESVPAAVEKDHGNTQDEKKMTLASKQVINGVLKEMYEQSKEGLLCDVVFQFEDNDEIFAHKAVLASISPVFKAMLTNGMKESQATSIDAPQQLKLQEVSSDVLLNLIRFVYLGKISLTYREALLLLKAADMYQVTDLLIALEHLLCRECCHNNYIELWDFAVALKLEKLRETVVSHIENHFYEMYTNPGCMPFDLFAEVLQREKVRKGNSQPTILQAILLWIAQDENTRQKHTDCLLACLLLSRIGSHERVPIAQQLVPLSCRSEVARKTINTILQQITNASVGDQRVHDACSKWTRNNLAAMTGRQKVFALSERIYRCTQPCTQEMDWRHIRGTNLEARFTAVTINSLLVSIEIRDNSNAVVEGDSVAVTLRVFLVTDKGIPYNDTPDFSGAFIFKLPYDCYKPKKPLVLTEDLVKADSIYNKEFDYVDVGAILILGC